MVSGAGDLAGSDMANERKGDRAGNRATGQAKWTFMVYMAGNNGIAEPDIDLHGDSCFAEPGIELEPYARIFRFLRHGFDAQIIEFVDEAVIERHVSDLADQRADGIDICRDETQKIDVSRRPCHGETHTHQQKASLQDELFFQV